MRHVTRKAELAPSSLTASKGAGAREIERYRKHQKKPLPRKAFIFRAYKDDEVRHALQALFHGKCAYCESRYDITAPVDIEHFRPKNPAQDGSHTGYWWLAATWSNLLPSCIDCNRRRTQHTPMVRASLSMLLADRDGTGPVRQLMTGKESCFPVSGTRATDEPATGRMEAELVAEDAVLLDPTTDDPERHLGFYIDRVEPLGLIYAKGGGAGPHLPAASSDPVVVERAARAANVSVRGAVSIQVYGLNRLRLVQERTRVLRQLEFMAALMVDLSATADSVDTLAVPAAQQRIRNSAAEAIRAAADRLLAQIRTMAEPEAPFSTMVAAWIEAFTNGP